MRRLSQDGSITLFAVIVIVPAVILAIFISEVGTRAMSIALLEHRLRVEVMNMAASFNHKLLEEYGIFGVSEGEKTGVVDVVLSKSLGEQENLKSAILAVGQDQAGVVAVERVLGKLKAIVGYSGEAEEVLDTVNNQVGEIASQSVSSVIGKNLPDINLKEIVQGVWNLATALGENWRTVDWTWAWSQNGQINVNGILEQAKTYFEEIQRWNIKEEATNSVAYSAYVMTYFNWYGHSLSRDAVLPSSEAEYCAFGDTTGSLNIIYSFEEIYKVRTAVNFVDYLVTLEIPEPETLVICAAVLALLAATTDVISLMAGNAVPLSPHLEMVETDYEDYLIMFLLMEPSRFVLGRIGDVINMNLKDQGNLTLDKYYIKILAFQDGREYSYEYR